MAHTQYVAGPPNVGATTTVAGRPFVDGFCVEPYATPEAQKGAAEFVALWNAWPVDSERGRAILVEHYGVEFPDPASNGQAVAGEGSQPGTATAPGEPAASAGLPPEQVVPAVPAPPSQGEEGGTPVPNAKLRKALESLDPDVPGQWTKEGLPLMAALENLMGSGAVTRADVELAWPNFDRSVAREFKNTNRE